LSLRRFFVVPRKNARWTVIVPVVAAAAGLLFATSAQTSRGTDLRASGRSDLADVVRARTSPCGHASRRCSSCRPMWTR